LLLRDGRLKRLQDPGDIELEKRAGGDVQRVRRDPRELVKLLLSAVD
jgi:hypothetical protein